MVNLAMSAKALHDLQTLVRSFHPLVVIETPEEERVKDLLLRVSEGLGCRFFEWSASEGLSRNGTESTSFGQSSPLKSLLHLDSFTIDSVVLLKDFAPYLDDPVVARKFRELIQKFAKSESCLVLTGHEVTLPKELEHAAVRYELSMPTPEEIEATVRTVLASLAQRHPVQVQLSVPEGAQLIQALSGLTLNQVRQSVARAVMDDGVLDASDHRRLMLRKSEAIRDEGLLEYMPSEDNLAELGGFDQLKEWLKRASVGFTAEARELNLRAPRGILLTGVQGCGKSLAAKTVARLWSMPLLKFDAGTLYNKYVGESERNFRRATQIAESVAPVVLWIDEIEKAFAGSSADGSDSGTSRRLLGAFLTWMQEKKESVFVVGTANDLFSLPPEFLRKGRFDEIFFVDLPDATEREAILGIHLTAKKQKPTAFDLQELVKATDGFSGAEIEQAVTASLYTCLHAQKALDTAAILTELAGTVPLSQTRAEDLARLRAEAKGRFVPVRRTPPVNQ